MPAATSTSNAGCRGRSRDRRAARTPRDPDGLPPTRRGQIASERARYADRPDARHDERAPSDKPADGLEGLPPGYGLTFVRGWMRDPRHLVAVWDVNDPRAVAQADAIGWDRACLRALDGRNRTVLQVLVGSRSGTHHLALPPGRSIRLAIGLERPDGVFLTLARSAPVRLPPGRPVGHGPVERLFVPIDLDLRRCLRGEQPARPGDRVAVRLSAGWRLLRRLEVAAESFPDADVPPDLARAVAAAPASLPPPGSGDHEPADEPVVPMHEPSTSPPGWSPPPGGPRHWLDRWQSGSGGAPSSPWVGGRPR